MKNTTRLVLGFILAVFTAQVDAKPKMEDLVTVVFSFA